MEGDTSSGEVRRYIPRPRRKPPADIYVVGPGEGDNTEFGSILQKLRKIRGLSRAAAAAELGLSVEYLRLIEAGKRTPALGQMPRFLEVYQAEGGTHMPQPNGDVADFVVLLHPEGDPTFVEFRSRIREARRSGRRAGPTPQVNGSREDLDGDRAADLGTVVSLLTRARPETLRRIRELLEDELA